MIEALRGWTSRQKHVVAASYLGWTLDAMDFFLLVFVFKEIAAEFNTTVGTVALATTLTLGLAVWPKLYLLHVGDSRAYQFRQGHLTQLTKDQTMAQALVDAGALKEADLVRSPLRNILSSAIGGTSQPVVTHHDLQAGDVIMLCSDGLTKHVTDAQIEARFREMTSSEQVCRQLVDDALEGGGSDNVTVLISRTVFSD